MIGGLLNDRGPQAFLKSALRLAAVHRHDCTLTMTAPLLFFISAIGLNLRARLASDGRPAHFNRKLCFNDMLPYQIKSINLKLGGLISCELLL